MYDELWHDVQRSELGLESAAGTPSESLSRFVCKLVAKAGLETELSQLGVAEDAIDVLAEDATKQWTGTFNPRPLSQDDFREIYMQTFQREAC